MDVTAKATRSGDWWAIEVPEIPGLFTQAKRLDQVEEMVRDAAAMLGHDEVSVTIAAELDADDFQVVDDARERSQRLADAEAEAAAASRAAIARLRSRGLPTRDVAKLMDISPQRVSQIAKAMQSTPRMDAIIKRVSRSSFPSPEAMQAARAFSKMQANVKLLPIAGGYTKIVTRRPGASVDKGQSA